jgi:hypothetical protein
VGIHQGAQLIAVDADILQVAIIQALELAQRRIAVAPAAQARAQPAKCLGDARIA